VLRLRAGRPGKRIFSQECLFPIGEAGSEKFEKKGVGPDRRQRGKAGQKEKERL